jgi:hypothetical protein
LSHPATAELAAISTRIADDLDARADIVGRIRRETAERAREVPAAAVDTTPAPAPEAPASLRGTSPALTSSALTSPTLTSPTLTSPTLTSPPPAPPGKRRSSIQIALVVVGITLLSVFAVFGLVYAFVTFGSTVRMLIIAAGTLATLAAAAVLARRGLTATAEGVAALGTIVLVLDAWALLLNDPEGLGALPGRGYWGVALLIVGAVSALWSRWGRLASPAVAAAALLPVGAGLASAELLTQFAAPLGLARESTVEVFAGALVVIGSAGLSAAHVARDRPSTRRAAHLVARSTAAVAATVALVSLVDLVPADRFAPLVGSLALGVLTVAHLVPLAAETRARRGALDTLTAAAIGGGSALAVLVGMILTTLRIDQDRATVSLVLLASVVIAIVGEQLWRRSRVPGLWRTGFASGTIVAAAGAVVAGALAGVIGASAFAEAATAGIRVLPGSVAGAVATAEPVVVAALGALALSAGLVAASWVSLGRLRSRARAVGPALAVIAVLTVPLTGPWWLVMTLFAVLALGGAVTLRVALPRARLGEGSSLVAALAPLVVGAAFGAFAIGWAVERGWMIGLTIALVAIMLARTTTPHRWVRGVALGLAAALVLGVSPAAARELARVGLDWGAPAIAVLLATIVLLAIVVGGLMPIERLAAGGVALGSAGLALSLAGSGSIPFAASLAALTGALVVVDLHGRRPERWAARIAIPIVVASGMIALTPDVVTAQALVPLTLAALAVISASALAATVQRPNDARLRLATDSAVAVVGVALLAWSFVDFTVMDGQQRALALVAAAVIAVLAATSADGLFGSVSPRRHTIWLAVALASAALWVVLFDADVTQLEAFVLPVSGALLVIAALMARATRGRSAAVATVVSLALALSLLPLASASGVDAPWRLIIVGTLGAGLALLAVTRGDRLGAVFRGLAVGALTVGVATVALLAVAQVVRLGELVDGNVASGPLAVAEQIRIVVLVALLAALALVSWFAEHSRARTAVAATGAGLAAAVAGVAGLLAVVDPVELVSVPLALGLLGLGTLQLGRQASARSWPWLGPGILALLVPSLLAIDGAGEPLWRAIALGIAAAAVFVAALQRRMQAPFVLGGAVLLTHLLVQTWPLLTQVGRAVEWWIWLGLAGVLVVVIAARYERRVQNVRELTRRIADLR